MLRVNVTDSAALDGVRIGRLRDRDIGQNPRPSTVAGARRGRAAARHRRGVDNGLRRRTATAVRPGSAGTLIRSNHITPAPGRRQPAGLVSPAIIAGVCECAERDGRNGSVTVTMKPSVGMLPPFVTDMAGFVGAPRSGLPGWVLLSVRHGAATMLTTCVVVSRTTSRACTR